MFQLSKNSKDSRKGVNPKLIEIDDRAIQITRVDYGHGRDAGVRTAKRQNELYKSGASKADGYKNLSNHQIKEGEEYGNALDFYAFVFEASWEHHHLAMVGAAFLQAANECGYKISWGGLWVPKKKKLINGIQYGWDLPHIELIE